MSDNIETIVSMGYTAAEAKKALNENDGNVDDAIDCLFTGRRGRPSVARLAFDPDDVTVTDSIRMRAPKSVDDTTVSALETNATPSFSLMALAESTRRSHRKSEANAQVSSPTSSPMTGKGNIKARRAGDTIGGTSIGTAGEMYFTVGHGVAPVLPPTYEEKVVAEKKEAVKREASSWNPTSEVAKQTANRTRSTTKYEDTVAPSRPTAASSTSKKAAPKKKKGTRPAADSPLRDSAILSRELELNARADIETGIVLDANEQSASLPAPQSLGAIAVDGYDLSVDDYSIADPSISGATNAAQQTVSSDVQEISATLVDQDEEARIRQEQVNREVEKKLEEEHERAEVADVVTGFWCSPRIKRIVALGVSLVVLLAIVAIVLGTVLPQVLAPPPPTLAPTSAPTTSPPTSPPLPGLLELLSSVSLDGGVALETLATPQNNALKWLAHNNTNLSDYSDERKIQRYVLATLYYGTNGDSWENNDGWLSDDDECGWYNEANTCSNEAVSELSLSGNNLVGTIPEEIALLSSSVTSLSLGLNDMTGSIPSEIALMTNLASLTLAYNALTGFIPSEIALMTNLDMLWLNDNTFSGDFTCPDFITLCFISCLDKEILEALNEYDEENEEAILQALNSTKNSTCRSL